MEILVPILFFAFIFHILWTAYAYDVVNGKNRNNGVFVFTTIFIFGIFGFIACLLFPKKEN